MVRLRIDGRFSRVARLAGLATLASGVMAQAHDVSTASATDEAPPASWTGPFQSSKITLNGESVRVLERSNAKGALVRQLILGPKYRAFWIDADGDGAIERWELETAEGSVSLYGAQDGRFTFMDVEQQMKSETVVMKFVRNPRTGQYALLSAKKVPHRSHALEQSFLVSCEGDDEDKRLREVAASLNAQLRAGGSTEQLRSTVTSIVDNSPCGQPPYRETRTELVDAIMRVASSDREYAGRAGDFTAPMVKRGTYLQCLRDFRLEVHATRIEASFAAFLGNPAASGLKGFPLTCAPPETPGQRGSFNSENRTITLSDDARSFRTALPGTANTARARTDSYARTLFHELVHSSRILDEGAARTIEGCCGTPVTTDGNSQACNDLRNLVREKEIAQQFENEFARAIGAERLPAFMDRMRVAFGDQADKALDDMYLFLGRRHREISRDASCHGGRAPGDDSVSLGSCADRFRSEIQAEFERRYGDCEVYARDRYVENVAQFCGVLDEIGNRLAGVNVDSARRQSLCGTRPRSTGMLWFWTPSEAWAAEGSSSEPFCDILSQVRPIDLNFAQTTQKGASGAVIEGDMLRRLVPEQVQQDAAANAGGRARVVDSGAGRPTRAFAPSPQTTGATSAGVSPVSAPAAPARTVREEAIGSFLRESQSTISRARSALELASRAVVPTAAATERAKPSASFATVAVRDQTGQSVSYVRVPPLSVPDPLTLTVRPEPTGVASPGAVPSSDVSRDRRTVAADVRAPQVTPITGADSSVALRSSGTPGVDAPAAPVATDSAADRAARLQRRLEFRKLVDRLVGPYERAKRELPTTDVTARLLNFGVQVVDDEGRVHGAGFPTCVLKFDPNRRRLVRDVKPPCEAKDP